jgi:hypothetical protein
MFWLAGARLGLARQELGMGADGPFISFGGYQMAYRANFELTGEMPLLMHWDNIEGMAARPEEQKPERSR